MSILQALLIGLIYFVANTSFLCGLAYFTTWRPLISGFLVGLVLGDPLQGAFVGALINVLYLGYMSVGGTLGIGDAALAGIGGAMVSILVTPTAVVTTGLGVIAGILLGNLGFPLLTLRLKLDGRIVQRMEAASARGDARSVTWLNIVPAQALLFAITVLAATALAAALATVIDMIGWMPDFLPIWMQNGLAAAGWGLSGALGMALAMRFVFKRWGIGLFLAGFVCVVLLSGLPLVALLGGAGLLAIVAGSVVAIILGTIRLRRQRVTSIPVPLAPFWLWQFFSHSAYSFERLQGSGFASALAPIINRVYKSPEDKAGALKRQLAFFNTEVNLGTMLVSIVARMETDHAAGRVSAAEIEKTKSSLMGTLAGFGDPLIQGALLPCVLSTALVVVFNGFMAYDYPTPLIGLALYVLAIGALMFAIAWLCYQAGGAFGREAVIRLLSSNVVKRGAEIARAITAFMLGALAATPAVVSVPIRLAPGTVADVAHVALPLALTMLLYVLMELFRVRPSVLLLGLVVAALGMALAGVI